MKICPKCQQNNCFHGKKIFKFGLMKISIIKNSLKASLNIFNSLVEFLPTNHEMRNKVEKTSEDLCKCVDRIEDIENWYKNKINF